MGRWNGALLTDVNTVLQWAQTMTWKGLHPIVQWVTTTYERGKRISRQAFAPLAQRLQHSETLPRWSVLIEPLLAGPAPAEKRQAARAPATPSLHGQALFVHTAEDLLGTDRSALRSGRPG